MEDDAFGSPLRQAPASPMQLMQTPDQALAGFSFGAPKAYRQGMVPAQDCVTEISKPASASTLRAAP